MPESTVVIRVDDELKSAFAQAARTADRTTSQLLRDFMRDFVRSQVEAPEYETWFRRKVAEGLADARAGRVRSDEAVERRFAKLRASHTRKGRRARR
jgi:predicted transcriptional regulator